ncbi:hypothetical protein CNECB9_2110012 [Cupriavidus necator]|uniref:Uncharacterized protein n=1 Tax=Cupriavidus necator TaxID=106590 RepID=A0A1K0IDH2_CUPNE|nr:hypothetical protein CNECB9_2110012 [Cupriavidus necator]
MKSNYIIAGVLQALHDTGLCDQGAAGTDIRLSPAPRLIIAAIAGLSMIGCAIIYEGMYDYSEGWRKAKIAEIGFGREIAMRSSRDCRKEMPTEAVQLGGFAVVQFEGEAGHQFRIAPLPKQSTLQLGDLVYVNIVDCARPLIPP